MDFCRQATPINEVNQEDWFKKISRDKSMIVFIISDDGNWVGYAGLSNIDNVARRAEISCFIDPDKQGKGYAKDGINMLLEYGFRTLNFQKICTDTFDFNRKEIEFMKELGFKESGILPRHYFKRGKYVDSIILSYFVENFDLSKLELVEADSKPL